MLTTVAVTAVSTGLFLFVFQRARIVAVAQRALATSREAVLAMRHPTLDDDAREAVVRRAAVSLFAASGSLILRGLAAVAAAVLPIVLADFVGVAPLKQIMAFVGRLDVFVSITLFVLVAHFGVRAWSR